MTPDDLRRRRRALRMSQAELGRRLDVSQNTVSRWEAGKFAIEHPGMLELALRTLEVEFAAMLLRHGEPNRSGDRERDA